MVGSLIKVVGLEQVTQMLDDAPRHLVARAFVRALHAAAEAIANPLEDATPVKKEDTGGLLDKGELRESLTIKVQIDSQYRGGNAQISFGKNQFVADWVEYGHKIAGSPSSPSKAVLSFYKGKLVGNVPMHPFMRPVADVYWEAAVEAFADSITRSVTEDFPQGR